VNGYLVGRNLAKVMTMEFEELADKIIGRAYRGS